VFLPQVQPPSLPVELQNVPSNYLFSDWIAPKYWDANFGGAFSNGATVMGVYIEAFQSACRNAPECSFDNALNRCYEYRPELSTSGGGAHQAFQNVIISLISIRIAYELFCLAAIAISCARNSVIPSCRIFMIDSAFFPLLLIRTSTRETILDFVLAEREPKHFIMQLFTSGLFIVSAKLFADTYYLLKVAQNGLVLSNWLSLILGLVTVPKLIGLAGWTWCKARRDADDSEVTTFSENEGACTTKAADGTGNVEINRTESTLNEDSPQTSSLPHSTSIDLRAMLSSAQTVAIDTASELHSHAQV
jgi:hypothetical protein